MPVNTSYRSLYDKVIKYKIEVQCKEPLHVGSGMGEAGGILIHPVLGQPFLQAAGIAGAFRDFFSFDEDLQKELFGTQEVDGSSKVRFSDGFFDEAAVYTELRPRVCIDRRTGTCLTNQMKNDFASGQKFEMELVAAGSVFTFSIYIYEKEKSFQNNLEEALKALHSGFLQFGGQRGNGCGYVTIEKAGKAVYDMRDRQDRSMWLEETKPMEDILSQLSTDIGQFDDRTHFCLTGQTEGSLLVKALCVKEFAKDSPDAVNIQNHKKEYIIPASSLKGVVKSQMEKICAYKGLDSDIIDTIFGRNAENNSDGILGCIRFYDCAVGNTVENDSMPSQKRIHIDKFTGGVMYQGLFSEKAVCGDVNIKVDIIGTSDAMTYAKAKGLLLLVLRDIGIGVVPLGSGSSIGRGFIKGRTLTVSSRTDGTARIDFSDGKVVEGESVIESYLTAL